MKFEVFPQCSGALATSPHYWRLKGRNGRIQATGHEPFASRANAKRACKDLLKSMYACAEIPIVVVDK